jgi:hypothetical protein
MFVAATVLLAGLAGNVVHADPPREAVKKISNYLDQKSSAETVLSVVHMYTDYKGHEFLALHAVTGKPNNFAMDYRYKWADDGVTDLRFFCDANGSVYNVQVLADNGELNRPFVLAQASIKIISQVLLNNSDLTAEQRAAIQKLIDAEDAKGLLILMLP